VNNSGTVMITDRPVPKPKPYARDAVTGV